jgi:hypothetical protein
MLQASTSRVSVREKFANPNATDTPGGSIYKRNRRTLPLEKLSPTTAIFIQFTSL